MPLYAFRDHICKAAKHSTAKLHVQKKSTSTRAEVCTSIAGQQSCTLQRLQPKMLSGPARYWPLTDAYIWMTCVRISMTPTVWKMMHRNQWLNNVQYWLCSVFVFSFFLNHRLIS